MAEQMKLAESMKNIEPLINGFGPILDKAHGLLGSIDTKSFDNIKEIYSLSKLDIEKKKLKNKHIKVKGFIKDKKMRDFYITQ